MNNKEVYINDILVDLDEAKSPIRLTYAVNDLAELKDRQAYSTNSFKLPLTNNNLIACGFPLDAPIIGVQPYRKNTGKIVQGGIEVLVNGIAIITGASDNIQVQILSGLKGFFDSIADKKISELDLSAYDHFWTKEVIASSQGNTSGYIYPVIDYGALSATEKKADARQLRPATFRKTIIETIASEAGYSISGSYSAYDKYQRSLVAFANDRFEHSSAYQATILTTSARKTVGQVLNPTDLETVISFEDSAISNPYGSWDGIGYTQTSLNFRATVTVNYSIEQQAITSFGSLPDIAIRIQKLIGGVFTDVSFNATYSTDRFVTETFANQQVVAQLDLVAGDKIRVMSLQQPTTGRVIANVIAGASVEIKPIVEDVIYGSEVQLSATLPDISQKNFFKDFLQMFGLVVIPDNYNKSLLLINMEDVYDNKPNATDITSKLLNSVDDVSYALSNYGINNIAKYKDDDNVDDALGRGVMVLDNQTLDSEVTIIESVFAATENVVKLGGILVANINKIEDATVSLDFKVKTQPRILLNNTQSTAFDFFDGSGSVTVSLISIPKFDGLGYDLLLQENYPEILRMLYRPFIVTKQILLNETDIANIDWRIPVYDQKSASYYYKNVITYQQGSVSTISLIRMP